MRRGKIGPGELKASEITDLPDGRIRLTRWRAISVGRSAATDMFEAFGTVDPAAAAGVAGGTDKVMRLINQMIGDLEGEPVLIQIYEEIPETAEIQVGNNTRVKLEDGREAIEAEFLQFSTGTYAPGTVGTTTAPGDASAFMQRAEQSNDGTLRRIKRTYVYAGIIATSESRQQGSTLTIKTITSVKTVPATPSGYTLIGLPVQNPNGLPTYTYTFAKGEGLAAVSIISRQDGLREVTYISLGTRQVPAGVITRDDNREADGYVIYTVGCMQAADGSDPAGATISLERYIPFMYPGRAKAYTEDYDGKTFLSCFESPPVPTEVKGTIAISYTTTSTLGTITNYWNPSEWATIKKQWVGAYGRSATETRALPGYRSMNQAAVTVTGDGFDSAIDGGIIYAGTTARIVVTGGPADPGGTTKTLHAELELAFTSTTGTKYFRKTLITAAIPVQADLPV